MAPENPVLWTGMKDASAESRKQANQMLKQVQHDMGSVPIFLSSRTRFGISILGFRI